LIFLIFFPSPLVSLLRREFFLLVSL